MAKKDKISVKKGVAIAKKGEPAKQADGDDAGAKSKKATKDKGKRAGKGAWHVSSGGDDLEAELASLGLRIKEIVGDGNCFFRALSDQLQGDEKSHGQLRARVVGYIGEHQDDFAPFIEDDESFGSYVARMRKDGTWAGYMEVVAASRCLEANLTIYQAGQPRWRVLSQPEDAAPMLHLSYHDGQHYNSVRCADDFSSGTKPAPVVIRGDGTLAVRPQRAAGDGDWDERDELRVAESTACSDMALVRRALEEARGDVDGAIERVIEALAQAEPTEPQLERGAGASAEVGAGADPSPSAQPPEKAEASDGAVPGPGARDSGGDITGAEGEAGKQRDGYLEGTSRCSGGEDKAGRETRGDGTPGQGAASGAATAAATPASPSAGDGVQAEGVKAAGRETTAAAAGRSRKADGPRKAAAAGPAAPSNNKRCPCGSGKKYKACCGPAAAAAGRRRAAGGDGDAGTPDGSSAGGTVLAAQVAALVI
ncbi:hypothetical protein GPECTOR_46g244 [Gonium pectorale]|uniref:OTU domain-containing protein n=1 Tax=Gonium pectorale TaxID=33097 RepID=A0A150G9D7_GONPE|nr:hypothetical protein GPECTOR_46g244 [Gonium pectorale]|eukprot:KXZ46175.1 hypothetical protein GPECTOR_46g244 [Gonium pectorale]